MHSFLLGEAFRVEVQNDAKVVYCTKCRFSFGPTTSDPKLKCLMNERTVEDVSEFNTSGLSEEIVIREFCCPKCGHLKSVNVQKKGSPILAETQL